MIEPDEDAAPTRTVADQTYGLLRQDIVSGALKPGQKLGMEMLTSRYDVGMSPVREALVRLTGEALVRAEGQRGFWVSTISLDELDDTMKTRRLIETEALALSIERGDRVWEEGVQTAFERLSVAEAALTGKPDQSFANWDRANKRFHDALVSACGSPWLIRLRSLLHQHSERYQAISLSSGQVGRDVHDEHDAIASAAIERKTLKACRLTEVHIDRTAEMVREALKRKAALEVVEPVRRRR